MIYSYACDDCRVLNDVSKPVSMAGEAAACPVCGIDMRRVYYAPALLNRKKPGSIRVALERGIKQADGKASVLKALHDAEQVGGDRWREVRSQTLSAELKQMQEYKKVIA